MEPAVYIMLFVVFFCQWAWLYLSPWRRASKKNTWKVSFVHSLVTFIGSTIVIWIHTPDIEWFAIKNADSQSSILLVLWSMAYFLCDIVAGCIEDGVTVYTWHHLLVLWSYTISLYAGHSIKGIMYHLFYSEMGNICYGARAIGIFGMQKLQQGLGDSIFLFCNRVAWFIHLGWIGLAAMLRDNFRVWDLHDYCAFYGSALLMVGDAVFAILLLKFVVKKLLEPATPKEQEQEQEQEPSTGKHSVCPSDRKGVPIKPKWHSKAQNNVKAFCINLYKTLRQD